MNKHFRQNRGAGESLLDMPPLRRVLMVGAVTDPSGELSRTDRALLDFGLDPLRKTGLPVASDGGIEVEVMNKADAFGRRDFLSEEGVEADIVILCNIPHKSDEDEYASSYSAIKSSLRFGFEEIAHHELSDRHWEPGIWAQRLRETGASVIISYGTDSMPLEQITPRGYFHSRQLLTLPSSGAYIMNSDFISDLPFSQWVSDNPELFRFILDTQKHDLPDDLEAEGHDAGEP
ncbi:MAG: hypothetical protein KDI90_09660 [Alphaproteobacteria bacterium]|nr:hypothetical protein [Alphaproteobacteria bacterium]